MKVENLLFVIYFLELLAAVVATITFHKYKASTEKYFLYFLWYTFFLEVVGVTIGYTSDMKNFWVYNAFTITSFLFYFYWYASRFNRKSFKRTVIAFTIMFVVAAFISLFYQSWEVYHTYTFITGAFFVLVLTLMHFYQLLNSDEVLVIKHKLAFWISTALLLFYMGMIPLFVLAEYIPMSGFTYVIMLVSLNLILYGCYIVGFIWTKKKYNHF